MEKKDAGIDAGISEGLNVGPPEAREASAYPYAPDLSSPEGSQVHADPPEVGEEGVEEEDVEGSLADLTDIVPPLNPGAIAIDTKMPDVDLLMTRIKRGEIDLNPDFQRSADIWDTRGQSRLIESLLLRIPLPVFYMAADYKGNWQVVDGLQRLDAIKRFVLDKTLRLRGLEYFARFERFDYDQLPRPMQRRINETWLTCHVIKAGTPPEVMLNVFKRVNTQGKPLAPQEVRHAVNPGRARSFLNELSESREFKDAVDNGVSSRRMADRECVLRFIAFYAKGIDSYAGHLEAFLAKSMKYLNEERDEVVIADIRRAFFQAMRLARAIFGDEAFRKIPVPGRVRRCPVNKPLFESLSVALANVPEAQTQRLIDRRSALLKRFHSLMRDEAFFDSITRGTQTTKQVRVRFERIEKMVREALK